MKYFITGFRQDDGWDNGGEEISEDFNTKEEAEAYIKELLNRNDDKFDESMITVICGEVVHFTATAREIIKVQITP